MLQDSYRRVKKAVQKVKPRWISGTAITRTRKFLDQFMLGYRLTENDGVPGLVFKKGKLAGQTILFPTEVGDISWVPIEVAGYFSQKQAPINEGGVVYDGGAWPGDFSVLASRIVGQNGKVYAFEPNPV